MNSILLSVFVSAVAAGPVATRTAYGSQPDYSSVSAKCTGAQWASATSWCASLLSIPVSTTTVTTGTVTTTVLPTCGTTAAVAVSVAPLAKRGAPATAPSCLDSWSNNRGLQSLCGILPLLPTVTVSVAATSTMTGPFSIQGINSDTTLPSLYATNVPQSDGHPYIRFDDESTPDTWYMSSNGSLIDASGNPQLATQFTDPTGNEPVILSNTIEIATTGFVYLNCSIDAPTCKLDCAVNGNTNNFQCYNINEWYISPVSPDSSCYSFQPVVVY